MQFSGRKKKALTNCQAEVYGHVMQFYGQPPLENISLSEFEAFAVDRLKCKTLLSHHKPHCSCEICCDMHFKLLPNIYDVIF